MVTALRPFVTRRLLIALLAALLLPAASAHAGIFPGEVVDGPSADILSIGNFDVSAADGDGAVTYLRNDGGVPHVFLARLGTGKWQPPERVDGAFSAAASDPLVAAGVDGKLIVAWIADGTLYVNQKANTASAWTGPQAIAGPATLPALEMGYNDNAYIAWSSGSDVLAARMSRGASTFSPVDGPLDLDASRVAGATQSTRVSIAVSADGLMLATWGEVDAAGRSHVIARRVDGATLSPVPTDVTVDQLDGRAGGDADAPQAVIQSDSSFGQVVFREAFNDGGVLRTRGLARNMRGSAFEPPVTIDGQDWPGEDVGPPTMVTSGSGTGFAVTPHLSGVIFARTVNADNEWTAYSQRIDSAPVPLPGTGRVAAAYAENKNGLLTWLAPDGMLRMRSIVGVGFLPEQVATKPELGPVDYTAGVSADGDRYFNGAILAIQGTGDQRSLTATMIDQQPGGFSPLSSSKWFKQAPGRLAWYAPDETWGGLTYTLEVDGFPVGETTSTSYPTSGLKLGSGVHLWRIVARDERGQTSTTPTRVLRIDADAPRAEISFSGARSAGARVTVHVRTIDTLSGADTPTVFFGDGTSAHGSRVSHAYRKGRYTVTVRAQDRAGNTTTERRTLIIR